MNTVHGRSNRAPRIATFCGVHTTNASGMHLADDNDTSISKCSSCSSSSSQTPFLIIGVRSHCNSENLFLDESSMSQAARLLYSELSRSIRWVCSAERLPCAQVSPRCSRQISSKTCIGTQCCQIINPLNDQAQKARIL